MGQFNLGDCETPKPQATMFNIPDELEGRQVAVRVPVGFASEIVVSHPSYMSAAALEAGAVEEVITSPPVTGLVQWAVACVQQSPGKTPRELAAIFSNGDHKKFNRRLPEAEKKGLVRRGEFRKCSVSGFATEWWPAEKA